MIFNMIISMASIFISPIGIMLGIGLMYGEERKWVIHGIIILIMTCVILSGGIFYISKQCLGR